MYIPPRPLTDATLPADALRADRTQAEPFEDCGLGKLALYVDLLGMSRMRYLPLARIQRIYKRLAVSKGFFEQGKVYGTLAYLVVCTDGGERTFRFTHEANLDNLLEAIRSRTDIPVGKPK